jgi:tetratricopeptide (TPR) repeat protein
VLQDQGHVAEAVHQAERACLLADRTDDHRLRHRARNRLANALVRDGRAAQAVPHLEAAITAARGVGDDRLTGQALNNLANALLSLGDAAAAVAPIEESLRCLASRTTDPFLVISLQTHAETLYGLGHTERALVESRRALELGRAQGYLRVETYCAEFIGMVLHRSGRPVEAREHWQQALEHASRQGRPVDHLKELIATVS